MKINTNRLIMAGICGLLLCASWGYADENEPPEKYGRKDWQERREMMYKKLGLSDEQQKKLKEDREKGRAQARELREKIRAKKEEIRDELEKENFDVDKVKAIHAQIKSLQAQAEDGRLDSILAVRQVLTPEQFRNFMELKKEHGNKPWSHRKGLIKDNE